MLRGESSGTQGFLALHSEGAIATEGGRLFYQPGRGKKRTPEILILLESPGILSHFSFFPELPRCTDVQMCRLEAQAKMNSELSRSAGSAYGKHPHPTAKVPDRNFLSLTHPGILTLG